MSPVGERSILAAISDEGGAPLSGQAIHGVYRGPESLAIDRRRVVPVRRLASGRPNFPREALCTSEESKQKPCGALLVR
jgi:hypothetical protein